jgi:hypothetical protein
VTSKEEREKARARLKAVLADYQSSHPTAATLKERLSESNKATLEAIDRILDLWPAKPVRRPLPPEGWVEITGREDEFIPPPWWSLLDALVAGLVHRATVVVKVGNARRVLKVILEARSHVDRLDWIGCCARLEPPARSATH